MSRIKIPLNPGHKTAAFSDLCALERRIAHQQDADQCYGNDAVCTEHLS